MGEERQAYVVQVTKPDPAMRGGLSTVLYVVLTTGPENAAAIVRRAVGEEVEATGDRRHAFSGAGSTAWSGSRASAAHVTTTRPNPPTEI
jgi:hypothetical protein